MPHLSRLEQSQKALNIIEIATPVERDASALLPFNPERDVPEKTWERMEELLRTYLLGGKYISFVRLAADMRILDHQKTDQFIIQIDAMPRQYLHNTYLEIVKKIDTLSGLKDFAQAWMAYPRLMGGILEVNDELESSLQAMFKQAVSGSFSKSENDHVILVYTKLVLESFQSSLLPQDLEQQLIHSQNDYIDEEDELMSDWLPYIQLCAWHRILFPTTFPGVPQRYWPHIKEALASHADDSSVVGFAKYAAFATLAGADDLVHEKWGGLKPIFMDDRAQAEVMKGQGGESNPPVRRTF